MSKMGFRTTGAGVEGSGMSDGNVVDLAVYDDTPWPVDGTGNGESMATKVTPGMADSDDTTEGTTGVGGEITAEADAMVTSTEETSGSVIGGLVSDAPGFILTALSTFTKRGEPTVLGNTWTRRRLCCNIP